jgi:hypothetical protein
MKLNQEIMNELKKNGYDPLSDGGWFYVNPEIIPQDWDDICSDFGIDSNCDGAYLAIMGVKEHWRNK